MGLTKAQVLATTARQTWIVNAIEAACGTDNVTDNTTGIAGANEEAHILGSGDAEAINALLPSATRLKERLTAKNYFGAISEYLRDLDAALGGINNWLATNGEYVSAQLRKAYPVLQARYCFPPVTSLGTVTNSAGTWGETLDVNGLNAEESGPAMLEAVPTGNVTVEISLTVNGVDFAGNIVSETATLATSVTAGQAVALGTSRFARITGTTVSGGATGDDITIRTKFDRAAAL